MSTRMGMYLQQKDYQEKQDRLKKYFNPSLEAKEASKDLVNYLKENGDHMIEYLKEPGEKCNCKNCDCEGDK